MGGIGRVSPSRLVCFDALARHVRLSLRDDGERFDDPAHDLAGMANVEAPTLLLGVEQAALGLGLGGCGVAAGGTSAGGVDGRGAECRVAVLDDRTVLLWGVEESVP